MLQEQLKWIQIDFFPADINIKVKQGRLIQEQLISLTFDAENISIKGTN